MQIHVCLKIKYRTYVSQYRIFQLTSVKTHAILRILHAILRILHAILLLRDFLCDYSQRKNIKHPVWLTQRIRSYSHSWIFWSDMEGMFWFPMALSVIGGPLDSSFIATERPLKWVHFQLIIIIIITCCLSTPYQTWIGTQRCEPCPLYKLSQCPSLETTSSTRC